MTYFKCFMPECLIFQALFTLSKLSWFQGRINDLTNGSTTHPPNPHPSPAPATYLKDQQNIPQYAYPPETTNKDRLHPESEALKNSPKFPLEAHKSSKR